MENFGLTFFLIIEKFIILERFVLKFRNSLRQTFKINQSKSNSSVVKRRYFFYLKNGAKVSTANTKNSLCRVNTSWWMDSGNTNEFQRKIQRIRRVETTPADENYRKIDGVTCLVQSSRDSKSSRRFRIELSTAVSDAPPFCKPIIIASPSSTPIFANRAMNYSSNRSATDSSCSFFTSYDSSR